LTTRPAPAGAPPAVFPLLADGCLRLECDPALAPLLDRWLPLLPYDQAERADGPSVIRVAPGDPTRIAPASAAPALRLGTADAHVDAAGSRATVRGSCCAADIDLSAPSACISVGGGAADDVAWDLYHACTLVCALLLGRLDRALVHAAAVVGPGGGAWLLTGDTHAGKSTTSVNLITAGWRFVSDDNVVLFRGADGRLWVEGWPRRFHLDAGWHHGRPGQPRGEVDPHERWPGRWLRTAPLAGLLFPRVEAGRPTELSPLSAAEALAALLRQSPWLLADRARAPDIFSLLRSACERPAHALRLGLDTYRDTDRLLQVLSPLG
jgi:hypothetical protein